MQIQKPSRTATRLQDLQDRAAVLEAALRLASRKDFTQVWMEAIANLRHGEVQIVHEAMGDYYGEAKP